MIDSEQYREGNGEIVIQKGKIEKLLKFKIYKLLELLYNYNVPFA